MPALTRTFVIDTLERVFYTFCAAFIGAVSVGWAGSGLDVENLTDWSAWQKLVTAAVIAGLAAAVTTVKTLIAGLVTGTGSTSKKVAETAVVSEGDHAVVEAVPVLSTVAPPAVLSAPADIPPPVVTPAALDVANAVHPA